VRALRTVTAATRLRRPGATHCSISEAVGDRDTRMLKLARLGQARCCMIDVCELVRD
jgi:hypothetical protein